MAIDKERARILIVDDERDFVELVKAILEGEGHDVIGATNSDEAAESYSSSNPDLVILDVMMEHLTSGLDLLRRFRCRNEGARTPVILLSSFETVFELDNVVDESWLDVERFLRKPLDSAKLVQTVDDVLSRRGA